MPGEATRRAEIVLDGLRDSLAMNEKQRAAIETGTMGEPDRTDALANLERIRGYIESEITRNEAIIAEDAGRADPPEATPPNPDADAQAQVLETAAEEIADDPSAEERERLVGMLETLADWADGDADAIAEIAAEEIAEVVEAVAAGEILPENQTVEEVAAVAAAAEEAQQEVATHAEAAAEALDKGNEEVAAAEAIQAAQAARDIPPEVEHWFFRRLGRRRSA